ncbi:lipase 3-like [Harmonia axyridis]|uniref:lipase 3-like n=1 Tax=Harmonia axyridis TaxID=115357 RepID=UPI001E27682F|nr:lipase 3-like [Harmonia axyridis]
MWNYQNGYREKITDYMEKLIKQDGYPLEKYSVTTKDRYINIMYRIPYGKCGNTNGQRRPAVLLNHGMICSSAIFIDQNPLGYYLADNGYDVWLLNNRGTTFSTKHEDYDAEKEKDKYWDFGFHEIAIFDLPAFIDFVLDHTRRRTICHIGFSQGATTFAIMASELPEYNEKINLSILLACPILFDNVSFFHVKVSCILGIIIIQILEKIFRLKLHEIPLMAEMRFLMFYAAKNNIYRKISELIMSLIVGYRDRIQLSELDHQRLGITTPNSSSTRQFLHYSQMIRYSKFAKYDYGSTKNKELYGNKNPPLYDLSKVTSPVGIFYGKNDMYNDCYQDGLEKRLGNTVHVQILDHEFYNHLDFLYAKDNIKILFEDMLKLMKKYCHL